MAKSSTKPTSKEIEQIKKDFKTIIQNASSSKERDAMQTELEKFEQGPSGKKETQSFPSKQVSEIIPANLGVPKIKLSNMPVFIKNKTVKILLVLGFVIPLVLLWLAVNILEIHQTNDFFSYMFVPIFFISVALLPLTGIIKDIAKLLPRNFFNRFPRYRPGAESYRKDPLNPTNKELGMENSYTELQFFSMVTGMEWLLLIFGSIFAIFSIIAPFITGHF